MAASYPAMLRTAVEAQSAWSAACLNLAQRWQRFAIGSGVALAQEAAAVLSADAGSRQNALEDAAWSAFVVHEQCLRALAGASRLSLLVMLNELDRRRGSRAALPPVPP